jgi:hypothetical protein
MPHEKQAKEEEGKRGRQAGLNKPEKGGQLVALAGVAWPVTKMSPRDKEAGEYLELHRYQRGRPEINSVGPGPDQCDR